jgi:ABC-type nickel/cobalt efflux system permease component RcnA
MSVMTKTLSDRAAWLWIAGAIVLLVLLALAFGDLSGNIGRIASEWQARLTGEVAQHLRSVGDDGGATALWALVATGFFYGVVHTLGPGHGKAVVVAYFLDGRRRRGWLDGILAGSWISITHTAAALVLAGALSLLGRIRPASALGQVRWIEIVSYGLIVAIGLWRLHAGLTGRLHDHDHGEGHDHGGRHGHDHGHAHGDGGDHHHHQGHAHGHAHHHRHSASAAPSTWRRFFRLDAGLGLLTAAGVAPCAGAVVMVLFASVFGVLWAGLLGVVAIAVGMAGTLAAIGIASMLAHRLLIGERTSDVVGRLTTVGAALIVVATGGFLLVGSLYRMVGT